MVQGKYNIVQTATVNSRLATWFVDCPQPTADFRTASGSRHDIYVSNTNNTYKKLDLLSFQKLEKCVYLIC